MGFLSKVKGFMNVGGVTVKMIQIENPFPRVDRVMKGRYQITTQTDATILKTVAQFIMKKTSGTGENRRSSETVIGDDDSSKNLSAALDYPFDMKAGETREMNIFMINVNVPATDEGGLMGTLSKLTGGGDEQREYFVKVTADVKGTPFDPSDSMAVTVI